MREWDGGKAWREGKRRSIDGKGGRKGSRYGEVPCLVGGSIGKGLSGRRAPPRLLANPDEGKEPAFEAGCSPLGMAARTSYTESIHGRALQGLPGWNCLCLLNSYTPCLLPSHTLCRCNRRMLAGAVVGHGAGGPEAGPRAGKSETDPYLLGFIY